jgi:hypothetical protein
MFHGEWVKNVSAGGCGKNNHAKYWTNPQYTFLINESDMTNGNCWVIIGLMQKNTRQKRAKLGVESGEEFIQYRIYRV